MSPLNRGYTLLAKLHCGEQALFVLDTLVDQALRSVKFIWNTPVPPREEEAEDEEIGEDAEVDMDKVEEDMAGVYSEEEEEDILHIDEISKASFKANDRDSSSFKQSTPSERPEGILESRTDAEEWRLEVERVTPQLKVDVKGVQKNNLSVSF